MSARAASSIAHATPRYAPVTGTSSARSRTAFWTEMAAKRPSRKTARKYPFSASSMWAFAKPMKYTEAPSPSATHEAPTNAAVGRPISRCVC